MKILIVMSGYFPGKKYGGPPVSVDNFCKLMNKYECCIVTHNHDMGDNIPYEGITRGWNNRENYQVKYLNDNEYNKVEFEKILKEIEPTIIYLQGIFQECVYPCLQLAKKYNINVILAPRGELCGGALSIKKYKKVPYICFLLLSGLLKGLDFHSTSYEESNAIHNFLKIPNHKIHFLNNIPSIPSKEYHYQEKNPGNAKFVFLSRIHPKKNLLRAIQYFEGVIGNVLFDIYGPIEDETYWKKCQESIGRLPSNIKVQYGGLVDHDQVHKIFCEHDVFLFPTLSENYGHVIVEALIVGCPVIISNQTPWNGVNDAGAGWSLPLDEGEAFKCAIRSIIAYNDKELQTIRRQASSYIKKCLKLDEIKKMYYSVFEHLKD